MALNDLFFAALAAALHEIGHVAAIYALGGRVERFSVEPGGLNIRYCGGFSHRQDALIALSGPAANLLAALFSALTGFLGGYFIGINLVFCFFNLIPISILDGGRILAPYLGGRAFFLDVLLISLLFVTGLLIWRTAANPTLVVASFAMLFLCLQKRRF